MVFLGAIYIIRALLVGAVLCHAHMETQINHCLDAAIAAEKTALKTNHAYILQEDDLRDQLSDSCAALRYEITKRPHGIRIVSKFHGEIWQVDEKGEQARINENTGQVVKVEKGKGNKLPLTPPVPDDEPPPPRPQISDGEAAFQTTKFTQREPVNQFAAAPLKAPLPPSSTAPVMLLGGPNSSPAAVPKEAKNKMQLCFSKVMYHSKPCTDFFADLEKSCPTASVSLSQTCVDYTRAITEVDLDDCPLPDADFARCELRSRQLEKKCNSPLQQEAGDCRALFRYLAKSNPSPMVVGRQPAQNKFPVHTVQTEEASYQDKTLISSLENVRLLDAGLQEVLRLKPVSFDWKNGHDHDLGFVAEEVALLDPRLGLYSEKGQLLGLKYGHITALLANGLQQLHSQCQSSSERDKEMIRRLVELENENSQLKQRLENQEQLLQKIKAKLGVP